MAPNPTRQRRGAILIEAMIGGVVLAIGLAVLITTSAHSLASQKFGEEQIVAASLLDELLSKVLMYGPVEFSKREPLHRRFDPPFDRYEYDLEITERGEMEPFFVTGTVSWFSGGRPRAATVQTYIALRRGDPESELREPGKPIIR